MYIFNSKFDTTSELEQFLIQLTCIISLLHNNYNKHLIQFLLEINTYLELMDNKITYYIWEKDPYNEDYLYFEDYIFQLLKNTPNPIFKSYLY